jgi:hypothetical protein
MKEFSVFEPILIRMHSTDVWSADFYDRPHINNEEHWTITGSLIEDADILPYNEETKHLHNTVGEFTKWKPKKGEPILVKDGHDVTWTLRIFLRMQGDKFRCTSDPSVSDLASGTVWDQAKPYINPFKE